MTQGIVKKMKFNHIKTDDAKVGFRDIGARTKFSFYKC